MLEPYLREELDEETRGQLRRHLGQCATCRARALTAEPSMLFALAGQRREDTAGVEACAHAVAAQVRQARLARRLGGRRRFLLAAAAALAVVAGGAVTWRLVEKSPEIPVPASAVAHTESTVAPEPPTVEIDMAGEDVRVYRFATDENRDTAVYFVVNPAMEL